MLDDSKGITLYSLGGLFISTAVGLVLAMVVLAAEVTFMMMMEIMMMMMMIIMMIMMTR